MRLAIVLLLVLPLLTLAELRGAAGAPGATELAPWVVLAMLAAASLPWRRGDAARARTPSALPPALGCAAAAGAAALAWFCPSPVRECAVAVAACSAVHVLLSARGRGAPDRLARCTAVALAALVATLVHWLSPLVLLHARPEAVLAHAFRSVLEGLGATSWATDRGVAFAAEGGTRVELGAGWVHSGLREALALLAGGAALFVLDGSPARLRRTARFAVALAAGVVARIALGAVTMLETRDPHWLADPWLRAVVLALPAAWMLSAWRARSAVDGVGALGADSAAAARSRVPARGAWLAAGGAALLVVAAFATGPHAATDERVAIDEGHSNWARLDVPIDRYNFGTLSVYNYAEWLRGLERRHGEVTRLTARLDDASLANTDVLILKTPTVPYGVDEVTAVHRFVERGGGLYVVGDHNDVFGMNTILNAVVQPYGIRYVADALNEIDYGGGGVVCRGTAFPPHALTRLMEPLHYMTSCTLQLSRGARPLLWTNHAFSDDSDYSKNNFIGDAELIGSERLGPLAQVAVATPGRGKVLAFTDSTLFSNFSIHFPGVRELAFGGVAWLAKRELGRGWRPWAAAVGAGLLLAAALRGRSAPLVVAAGALAGCGAAWTAVELDARALLEPWRAQLDGREVLFDTTISAGQLPIWHETHDTLPDNFWGLFLAFQRSGAPMRVALRPEDTFRGAAAVLVWPKHPLPAGFVDRAQAFVERGGTLFVFEDRLAVASAANRVLEPFGLAFRDPARQRRFHVDDGGAGAPRAVEVARSCVVEGGEPCVLDARFDPLVARAAHGAGSVVAVGLAEDLSNASMSTSGELRGVRGYELLRLVYRAIDAAHVTSDLTVAAY